MRRIVLWIALVLSLAYMTGKFAAAFYYFGNLTPDMMAFASNGFSLPFLAILNIIVADDPIRHSGTRFFVHAANLTFLLFSYIMFDVQKTPPTILQLVTVILITGCGFALERTVRNQGKRDQRLRVVAQQAAWEPAMQAAASAAAPASQPVGEEVFAPSSGTELIPFRRIEPPPQPEQ